jgi:hypothetical protein
VRNANATEKKMLIDDERLEMCWKEGKNINYDYDIKVFDVMSEINLFSCHKGFSLRGWFGTVMMI